MLEVAGQTLGVDVEKATLLFMAETNDPQVAANNLLMATRYIESLFPDWTSPGTWLEANALTSPEAKSVEREGRRITVKLSKELNMWSLTVEKI